jgi:serine/threonine-protein kinase RsbW
MTTTASVRPTGCPGYTETMPCTATSAGAARRLVRTALRAWSLDHLVDDGAVVVSELVSNASQHTASRTIKVTITRPGRTLVRIGVTDESHALPVRRTPGPKVVRGRGLGLVEALTCRRGADLLTRGKCVWGELGTPDD